MIATRLGVTDAEVIAHLGDVITREGVRGLSRRCGLSPSYISQAARGRVAASDQLLSAIGIERFTVYRFRDEDERVTPLRRCQHCYQLTATNPCQVCGKAS
jgi:hypothetical protein